MPLSGTQDISTRLQTAPNVTALATEPVELVRAQVLHVLFEIDAADMVEILPAALHPTVPPTLSLLAVSQSDGPFGAFTFAQARIGCRAGVRPRGFVSAGYIDNAEAGAQLADRWGFALTPADVVLDNRYHDTAIVVRHDGRTILDASLVDPVPLSGAEIMFAASMQLAHVHRDGEVKPRLVQVDPDFAFHRAARGSARLDIFDAAAWGEERINPVYPVSAWYAVCDLTLPQIRYLTDPDVTALQGTEKI